MNDNDKCYSTNKKPNNKHIGSTLDALLAETGDLDTVNKLAAERVEKLHAEVCIRKGRHALIKLDTDTHGKVFAFYKSRHDAGTAILDLSKKNAEGVYQYVDAVPKGTKIGAAVAVDDCRGPYTDARQNDALLALEKKLGKRVLP